VTFLAPWALWAAGAVSAAVIALHILASRHPRVTPLPTARFIPDVPLRATARALRLSDVLLMLVRVAAVMLVGVAFARPELARGRRVVGRVVMVDASRALASRAEAADSAKGLLARGDVLIAFDSSAHAIRNASTDSLRTVLADRSTRPSRGSLSTALAAAMRAASSLRADADSVEIVLVSPLAAEEWDAATASIRAAWPGRVRVARVAAATPEMAAARIEVTNASPDDPVRAAASLGGGAGFARAASTALAANAPTFLARIDRGPPLASDSAWARDRTHTLVRWPAQLDSSGWRTHARVDTVGALLVRDGDASTVVASPFARTVDPAPGRVVARWVDGTPAATEHALGAGCVRDVAIPIERRGDLALRESTRRLVTAMASPCGGDESYGPASDSALARLRGSGPLIATRALERRTAPRGHLATWLLAGALALLLVEPLLRRQRAPA
jgi:hypothetical protein